jgi:hypothetical protein
VAERERERERRGGLSAALSVNVLGSESFKALRVSPSLSPSSSWHTFRETQQELELEEGEGEGEGQGDLESGIRPGDYFFVGEEARSEDLTYSYSPEKGTGKGKEGERTRSGT